MNIEKKIGYSSDKFIALWTNFNMQMPNSEEVNKNLIFNSRYSGYDLDNLSIDNPKTREAVINALKAIKRQLIDEDNSRRRR